MTASLTAADLQPSLAGRYALERELGHGGMATVFLARDLKHDRDVAIKVLDPQLARSIASERFLREIGIAARPVMMRESLAWLDQYLGPVQRR